MGSGQVCRWKEQESGSGRVRYGRLIRHPSGDAEEAGDTGAWSSWTGPGCRDQLGVILAEMEFKALHRDKVTKGAYRYIGAGRARLGRVFRAPMTWGEHVGRCWALGPALPSFLTWISAQRVPANIQIPYPVPPQTKRSDPLSDARGRSESTGSGSFCHKNLVF